MMSDVLKVGRSRAIFANLLLPGSGLILLGWPWAGLLVGLTFALCANLAVAGLWLFPAEFRRWTPAALVFLLISVYAASQWILAQTLRLSTRGMLDAERRRLLREVAELLRAGEHAAARDRLDAAAARYEQDLLVALRRAQALTAAQDVPAALAAWERVAVLDRHGIYRHQRRECVVRLGGVAGGRGPQRGAGGPGA